MWVRWGNVLHMQIDKNIIIDLLKSMGKHEDASRAHTEMPDKVDTERDSGLLGKFGIGPEMLSKLTAGGGAGALLNEAKNIFKL